MEAQLDFEKTAENILAGKERRPQIVSRVVELIVFRFWDTQKKLPQLSEEAEKIIYRLDNQRDKDFLFKIYGFSLGQDYASISATLNEWLTRRANSSTISQYSGSVLKKGGGGSKTPTKKEESQRRAHPGTRINR